jgi:acetolactate synthase-1/2/3 large subunit
MEAAFQSLLSGRPRPVYVEIPRDVLASPAAPMALPSPLPSRDAVSPDPSALQAAASALRASEAPVLLVGGGAVAAAGEVCRLAERLGSPVVMTVNARGILPPGHPLAVPASPSLAHVRELVAAADVVLAVGTEFGETDYDMYSIADFPQPSRLIRIDIDPEQMRRGAKPDIELLGDASRVLGALLVSDLGAPRSGQGEAVARKTVAAARAALAPAMQREIRFLEVLRDVLPQAVMVGDSTQPVYAGNLFYAAPRPRAWFNSSTGYGTLGYALPASTGAALADPERPVICLTGDGGLQFTLGELAGPRDVAAWSLIVVWNNLGYGEIKKSMLAVDIEPEGVEVRPPDFEHLAKAYGYAYCRIDSIEALAVVLLEFASRRQVMMLEIDARAFE